MLDPDAMGHIAAFLPVQALLQLRRLALQWRVSTDASVDEQARAAAFFSLGAADGSSTEWSQLRWLAAARHVPELLDRHCGWLLPPPGSSLQLVGLAEGEAELNGLRAAFQRWDGEAAAWVVAVEGRGLLHVDAKNLRPEAVLPSAVRRRALMAVAKRLAVVLAARPRSLLPEVDELVAGAVDSCGVRPELAEPILRTLPLCLREHPLDEPKPLTVRAAVGSPVVDDYLVALSFLEDGEQDSEDAPCDVAQALQCPGGLAAGGAAGLLALLCASRELEVVRRELLGRVVQVQTELDEREELWRSGIGASDLVELIRAGGFQGEHFFTSHGVVASVDHHWDISELVRLAVRVRRARAIFDRLDADGDGRIQAAELLQFVDMAVPGLLGQQAARRAIPPALHRQQYAARMLQLRHVGGFVEDLVHGAYAEDREPVYWLVAAPPRAAASAAVLHRALSLLLTTPESPQGAPRLVAVEDLHCCSELASAVDLSRSLCLHVRGREVLGPPVAIAIRFHGVTFAGSSEGLLALKALASPAAIAKCASTDYSSERWCNDVPLLVTHLLESAGIDPGVSLAGILLRRRVTHAVEAEE